MIRIFKFPPILLLAALCAGTSGSAVNAATKSAPTEEFTSQKILSLIIGQPKRLCLAEDDAADAAYNSGWKSDAGGTGFGPWVFQSAKDATGESFAGFFIGQTSANPDMAGASIRDKAFGLFANGVGFEVATAFRSLKSPIAEGQTFSFLIKHGTFEQKSTGPAGGAVGITLRTGNASEGIADYNKGSRCEFGFYADKPNYQIYDGTPNADTGVPVTYGGLSVSFTLVSPDTYDLEITSLADKVTTSLKGRKLGGDGGGKIESFCIFDRNAEKNDAFFNGFQILEASK